MPKVTVIVGGSMGIATGSALRAKLQGANDVTVCFFGDGATAQGLFSGVNFGLGGTVAALIGGVALGLLAYGTYEFTNYATLKDWHPSMVITDALWGTVLTGVSAAGGVWATRAIFG